MTAREDQIIQMWFFYNDRGHLGGFVLRVLAVAAGYTGAS
jgi:hypothetical protein